MKILSGTKISAGVGEGPVYFFERFRFPIPQEYIPESETLSETERLRKAFDKAIRELTQIRDLISEHLDEIHSRIIEMQIMVLNDEILLQQISAQISRERKNATWAFFDVMTGYETMLNANLNEYQRERYTDLRDLKKRIVHHLLDEDEYTIPKLSEPSVFISERISPTDLIHITHQNALGIVTHYGGLDSHAGILARSFRIPYLSGVDEIEQLVSTKRVILDADSEKIIANPSQEIREEYQPRIRQFFAIRHRAIHGKPVIETRDGLPFKVQLNVSFLNQVNAIDPSAVQGIGLYRTEFLCIERNAIPDEEDQFRTYTQAVLHMANVPITFRIFDFGRDKFVEMLDLEMLHQESIFDDWGGIRFLLDNPEILRTQLRALLRSSAYGPIRIMLPMVATINEVRECRAIMREIQQELDQAGIAYHPSLPLGAMVETVAILDEIDALADEVDFFSIGTNDLSLFLFHTRRDEAMIKTDYHPLLLHTIQMIVEVALFHEIPVNICGEMASDPLAVILLIGIGIRSISVNPSAYLQIIETIRQIETDQAQQLSRDLLRLTDAASVYERLRSFALQQLTATSELKQLID